MKLNEMTEQQLQEFYSEVLAEYQNCLAQGLNLNMSRGKPGLEQLALSDDLLNMYIDPADTRPDGVEARNYGELMGLPACRRLFAELLGVRFEQVFACGNASLTLMYDLIPTACCIRKSRGASLKKSNSSARRPAMIAISKFQKHSAWSL